MFCASFMVQIYSGPFNFVSDIHGFENLFLIQSSRFGQSKFGSGCIDGGTR
jgi:hypothetical protein